MLSDVRVWMGRVWCIVHHMHIYLYIYIYTPCSRIYIYIYIYIYIILYALKWSCKYVKDPSIHFKCAFFGGLIIHVHFSMVPRTFHINDNFYVLRTFLCIEGSFRASCKVVALGIYDCQICRINGDLSRITNLHCRDSRFLLWAPEVPEAPEGRPATPNLELATALNISKQEMIWFDMIQYINMLWYVINYMIWSNMIHNDDDPFLIFNFDCHVHNCCGLANRKVKWMPSLGRTREPPGMGLSKPALI